jgi:DNA-3-methyladenine glycosylase II
MEYKLHLSKDKKLKRLIEAHEPLNLNKQKDIPFYLMLSIMSQQLSTKVAATIKKRFLALYDGRIPTPEAVIGTPFEILRSIGLSNAKTGYVHNVARFAVEQGMDHRRLSKMDNEAIIAYLTQIKGVGRWTTEMLLMFCLGREDVFAIDDWGIQNAMIHLYKLDRTDKKAFREKLVQISGKWSPYRTFACMHLWRWKDSSPVAGKNGSATGSSRSKADSPARTVKKK